MFNDELLVGETYAWTQSSVSTALKRYEREHESRFVLDTEWDFVHDGYNISSGNNYLLGKVLELRVPIFGLMANCGVRVELQQYILRRKSCALCGCRERELDDQGKAIYDTRPFELVLHRRGAVSLWGDQRMCAELEHAAYKASRDTPERKAQVEAKEAQRRCRQ